MSVDKKFLKLFSGSIQFTTADDLKGRKNHTTRKFRIIDPSEIKKLNQRKLDGPNGRMAIFFTVNKFTKGQREKTLCRGIRAVYVDDDSTKKLVTDWPIAPSIVVQSSKNKYHYYWLTKTNRLSEYEKVMQTMVDEHGADPKARDISRVMRVPGTHHYKRKRFEVSVIGGTKKRYSWDQIKIAFPPAEIKKSNYSTGSGNFDLSTALDQITTTEDLHGSMTAIAMSFVNQKISKNIFYTVMQLAEKTIDYDKLDFARSKDVQHRFEESHLDECYDSAKKKASKEIKKSSIPKIAKYDFSMPEITDKMPALFLKIIRDVSTISKVDPPLVYHCLKGAAAVAFNNNHSIKEKSTLIHKQTLSSIGISASGGRKSFVFKYISNALKPMISKSKRIHKKKSLEQSKTNDQIDKIVKQKMRTKMIETDSSIKDIRGKSRKMIKLERAKKDIPAIPTLYVDDITPESYIRKLHDQGGRLSICSSDARTMLNIFQGRYANKGDSGVDPFLKIITGDTITYSRRDADIEIENPSGVVNILVQGDTAMEFFGNPTMENSGILARIMPMYFDDMVGEQMESDNEPDLDQSLIDDLSVILKKIYFSTIEKTVLSKESKKIRRRFNNKMQRRFKHDLKNYVNEFNKSVTQAVQAAWIFACIEAKDMVEIVDSEAMRGGIAWQEYNIENALMFYQSYEIKKIREGAQELVNWLSDIKKHPSRISYFIREGERMGFLESTLKNNLRGNKLQNNLNSCLSILKEFGHITQEGQYLYCEWMPNT